MATLNSTIRIRSAKSNANLGSRGFLPKEMLRSWQLYVLVLPTLLFILIFQYIPMYGVVIAFKNFKPSLGILGSPWTGFRHFLRFFDSPSFWRLIENTLTLSLYQLIASFPVPIILALSLNIIPGTRFKKAVQLVTYAPHFISTVVVVGMMSLFFSTNYGIVNNTISALGGDRQFFLGKPELFQSFYVWSNIWQSTGWASIIYLAALSGVDPCLHEAAIVDGANFGQRIWHIDIPAILPTIAILLILNVGRLMSVGFEKVYLMQNALNLDKSEIISTYVYKVGLLQAQYSFASAVGLFNSIINFVLLIAVNKTAKAIGQQGLW